MLGRLETLNCALRCAANHAKLCKAGVAQRDVFVRTLPEPPPMSPSIPYRRGAELLVTYPSGRGRS
jgi:hypothetical protein